jgi:hypothetical protein
MINHPLEIPYRLETIEDITNAMQGDLLEMTDYKRLLHFAKEKTFQQPQALIKAKRKVTKDFTIVDEEKIRDVKITISEVADLPLIPQYPLVEESIPWIDDIICHESIFHFFHSFPLEIRKRFLLEHSADSPASMFSSVLAIRKILKKDLLVYVKAQKPSTLSLVQFRKSLVALTVFEPRNEDVLLALKTEKTDENISLHQNALAEILFARLPKTIKLMLNMNANTLVQKLSLKMSHLKLSSRHIMNLMGYINRENITSDALSKALNRIDGVAMKISIPQESKNKLHDYMESMKKNMDRAPSVYRSLFLSSDLEPYQKLYRSTKVIKSEKTVTKTVIERTVRQYTKVSTLDFYATKDYFDIIKSKFSKDCTDTYLGERQFMTSYFFNVRIFKGKKWIGNIYMLDFCQEHDSLIIDRIQMPRAVKASFHQFFDYLREVLIEMFEGVRYEYILMPLKISNHGTIQKIFNQHKKKLTKKANMTDTSVNHFESISGETTYYVLHKRPQG